MMLNSATQEGVKKTGGKEEEDGELSPTSELSEKEEEDDS